MKFEKIFIVLWKFHFLLKEKNNRSFYIFYKKFSCSFQNLVMNKTNNL